MIGQTISQYQILEKLGEGGMGVVYKAHDTKLDRLVALKFLSSQPLTSETGRTHFLKEARSAAALNHPNICGVIDIKESSGEEFLVMEYVQGSSLRASLEKGPLEIRTAVTLARQVAEGLQAAHSRGIVHRDIKPENIIVTEGGTAKIADFGLAALVEDSPTATSRVIAGTRAYMSPEQVRGEQADRRTDLWSLGVTLYEMVTGRRPFNGEYDQALLYAVVNERHTPASGKRPDIPPALETVIDRCLEKDPDLRYPDAGTLADALRRLEHATERRAEHSPILPQQERLSSIAVLPFADISPEKDNEYFSEGLTEEIIASLSKLKMLRVVSRTSVIRYERAGKSMKQIAADLGVQCILEGSVRKHGSDLRITAQLIDASQDASLWSEKYRGTMENIFDIQETVAAKIVKALKVRLTPGEKKTLHRRPTRNAEAYQLYLKGRFFWNKRTAAAIDTAIRYFQEAIQSDPGYALAWSGLADSYSLLSDYGKIRRKEAYPKARAAAEKALILDNQLAEAHTSLAVLMMLEDWDWENAAREFERAIKLEPSYATSHHWYSELLMNMGRIDDGIREIELAAQLDPLSPAIQKDKGMTLYYAGQYDTAIEEARKTLELDPNINPAHRLLSLCYQGKGMYAEALEENLIWEEAGGNPLEAVLGRAQILAVSGDRSGASALLESIPPEQINHGILYRAMALVEIGLGEHDAAFRWLEKAYEVRSETLCLLKVDPKLAPIRSDPRYHALVKKVGLA